MILIVAEGHAGVRFTLILRMTEQGLALGVLGRSGRPRTLNLTYLFFFRGRIFFLGTSYHSDSFVFFMLRRFFMYQGFLAS